ncbi:hypothetical protein B296_00005213 [Ensete ventricosum]|uniref:4Fe-4S ferredoxin-type domain-containing protein n=1 Tax=Ensete ventricosum TaxID=4639 RepID=A0A427BAQ9_ENSVE|nr:hypothetical protein B296_00005213 [Ensete ventricosum]
MATTCLSSRRLLVSVLLLMISPIAPPCCIASAMEEGYAAVVGSHFMGLSPRAGSRFLAQGAKKGDRCDPVASNACSGVQAKDGTQLLYCCKNHCRNVLSDRNNCGACGVRCGFGQLCCKGKCTAVAYDVNNCGKCGAVCQPGLRCEYGSSAANSTVRKAPVAPATKATGPKKPAFKLYERRNSLKNLKILSPLIPTFFNSNPSTPVTAAGFSPRKQPEILSPSILDFPSLVLSPITPLIPDPFNRSPHPNSEAAKWAEDRAIAEKGFYLHPSPRASAEAVPPRLLPLFPVTSPEVSSDLSLAMPRSSTRAV